MTELDAIIERLAGRPDEEIARLEKDVLEATAGDKWIPNPGPQTEAYFSKADCLLYGGEPGGGKSQLILGLAFNAHKRSLVMRRQYGDLNRLVEDALKIHGSKDGFNGSPPPKLKISDDQIIDFAAAHRVGDEQGQMGKGRDLLCVARGTPVLMADGSYKPIEEVRLGDSVFTLEGPKPLKSVLPVRRDHAVRVSVAGFSQIQSATHLLLTTAGWVGPDRFCGLLPSCSSSPTSRHASHKSSPPFWKRFSASLRRHVSIALDRLRSAAPDQQALGLQGLTVTCACTSPQVQGSACEASCASSQAPSLHSGLSCGAARLQLHQQAEGSVCCDQPPERRGASDVRASSSLAGSLGDCQFGCDSCDEPPLLWLHRGLSPEGDQSSVLQPTDVEQRSPIGSEAGGRGRTPIHTIRTGSYLHPYTKETRSTSEWLRAYPCVATPVGVVDLYDIEVVDANHYITLGGFINRNCIDETTHFAESQVRFLMGWNRSEDPNQRVRTVFATNPPLTAEGLWVIKMFAPWLDPQYPKPAKHGELRWVVSDPDGNDLWVDGPGEYETVVAGVPKMVKATSRTYIPASVRDNPYYLASGYEQQLDAMPEPYRSLLMGGFRTAFRDTPNQIIPTEWVRLAQGRWNPAPPVKVPMCAIGVDASGGGEDPMILACRWDGWYDELVEIPGKTIPMDRAGSYAAGVVIAHRMDQALVIVDMGGGYGGPMYEHLVGNQIETKAYKGAEASTRRSNDGKMRFTNKRTAAYWQMREALDPGQPGGSPIQLPPDTGLMADLTAPTFEVTPNGLKAESKEKVCDRLGRSTDRGDAVVMAWHYGPKITNSAMEWADRIEVRGRMVRQPQVLIGQRQPLSVRRRV